VAAPSGDDDVSRETPALADLDDGEMPIAAEAAAAVSSARTRALPFPRPTVARRLVVANQKGGVGKTTTTVNVAAAMAQHGLKVLVIDLDPQGNASTAFGIDHHADIPSIYDALVNDLPLAEAAIPVAALPGLVCIPATIDLAGAEIELVSVVARESRLKRALAGFEAEFDYILIDCPPSLGLLTVNALVAGDEVFIPIQCEYYALEGLGQLLRNVELVRAHLNPELHVSTILLTMYDARTRLADQVAQEVRDHFGAQVLGVTVPRSVRISEAPGFGQTVVTYDPLSRGATAYIEAAREIAERGAGSDRGAGSERDAEGVIR
jgi:chromosome partitioning protein